MTAGPDRWIRWTTIGCVALPGADRWHSLLPSSAPAGGVARAARLGCRPDAAVGGRDDRHCVDPLLADSRALADQSGDGALPSGRDIGRQHGRHERWGRLVKRSGLAGELDPQTWPAV